MRLTAIIILRVIIIQSDWYRDYSKLFISRAKNLILGGSLQEALINVVTFCVLFCKVLPFFLPLMNAYSFITEPFFLFSSSYSSHSSSIYFDIISMLTLFKADVTFVSGSGLSFYNQVSRMKRSLLCYF